MFLIYRDKILIAATDKLEYVKKDKELGYVGAEEWEAEGVRISSLSACYAVAGRDLDGLPAVVIVQTDGLDFNRRIQDLMQAEEMMARQIHAYAVISAVVFVAEAQRDDTAFDETTILEHAEIFPMWDAHWTGRRGSIVQDGGQLYRSIHDVGAGQNTKPSETPSMWTRIGNPAEEFPEWSQPLGAHDAYAAGDRVSHNGKKWVSDLGGNIWEPGVFGWSEVT